jgi:hypothetical protein
VFQAPSNVWLIAPSQLACSAACFVAVLDCRSWHGIYIIKPCEAIELQPEASESNGAGLSLPGTWQLVVNCAVTDRVPRPMKAQIAAMVVEWWLCLLVAACCKQFLCCSRMFWGWADAQYPLGNFVTVGHMTQLMPL